MGERFPAAHVPPYAVSQVVGGIAGTVVIYLIASGKAGFNLADGMASNGYIEKMAAATQEYESIGAHCTVFHCQALGVAIPVRGNYSPDDVHLLSWGYRLVHRQIAFCNAAALMYPFLT